MNLQEQFGQSIEAGMEFIDGRVKLKGVYDGKGVDIELAIVVEAGVVLDAIEEQIPGDQKAIFAIIKAAFLK